MLTIAVTDTMGAEHKFQRYITWLQQGNVPVDCVRLSYKQDNLDQLRRCDGLVLTGGNDVDPLLYVGATNHPMIKGVDRRRDDFEQHVIDRALKSDMPVLGICRGLQITNVYFGGTLFVDLEEAKFRSHRSLSDGAECRHPIIAEPGTVVTRCTNSLTGTINSSHHQAADRIGSGLRVTARADDGVIEAIEQESSEQFFLLVQWHPERMTDTENPFAQGILVQFLFSMQQTARGKHSIQKEM